MQRRFRQRCTALREHWTVGFAKFVSIGGFCDLDLLLIKATSPDDVPLPERYVHELIKVLSFSVTASRSFVLSFTRRFRKTRCWRVALKCLVLLHRLLRSLPESNSFRSDILWCRSNGLLSLYPCHFRDSSSSASEDFTFFIRRYACLLDEALDCDSFVDENGGILPESVTETMKEVGRILDLVPQLQSLIDRVIDCYPIGAAARRFIVRSAMKQIIRDSFHCYKSFQIHVIFLLDNLVQMQYRRSVSTMRIYKKAASQLSKLSEFYELCMNRGLCGSYECLFVEKIPLVQVSALESFLNERWQLTESSSSTSTSTSTSNSSASTVEGADNKFALLKPVISTEIDEQIPKKAAEFENRNFKSLTEWEKFEEQYIEEPLIQLEENYNSWEVLLEASTNFQWVTGDIFRATGYEYGCRYGYTGNVQANETDGWKMQVFNPNPLNPFCHGLPLQYSYSPGNPNYYYPGTPNYCTPGIPKYACLPPSGL